MGHRSWAGLGVASVFCSAFLSGCSDQAPSEPATPGNPISIPLPTYAAAKGPKGESRFVVQFKKAEGADFENKVKALGGKVARRHQEIATVLVTGLTPANAATLRSRADVEEVDTDLRAQWIPRPHQLIKARTRVWMKHIGRSSNDQSDAALFREFQWNLRKISAPAAWRQTQAGKGVTVCLLDTGIDPDQVDIKGKVNLGLSQSFVASEPFIEDYNFHGTFNAGLVSSNGLGTASVAPAAKVCALKVLDSTGTGDFADVIAAIVYAGVNKVQVINMSLGALLDFNDPDQRGLARVIQRAIDYAHKQGTVILASSGNDNLNLDQSVRVRSIPAQLDHVISVGATGPINQQRFDRLASYSNYGKKGNDLVAPGGESIDGITLPEFVLPDLIVSVCSRFVCGDDGFVVWADGTSFAVPHVAGTAAVVESNLAGNQSPDKLERCIKEAADHIGAQVFFGAGRLDEAAAAHCQLLT